MCDESSLCTRLQVTEFRTSSHLVLHKILGVGMIITLKQTRRQSKTLWNPASQTAEPICSISHGVLLSSLSGRMLLKDAFLSGPWPVWLSFWVSSQKAKGRWLNSQSDHMPGLWVWSPVGAHVRGNRLMFLSHTDVSLPLFLSPFLSL